MRLESIKMRDLVRRGCGTIMRPMLKIICTASVGFLLLAAGSGRAQTVTVTVPGTADPWLAGMPAGSVASCGGEGCDYAPAESPAQVVGLSITPGAALTFSATGGVSYGSGHPLAGPDGDGSPPADHSAGAENGISDISAVADSLLGVFLGPDEPDLTPAPPPATSSQTPALKQVFLIGSHSTVTVPSGATRLFLGPKDGYGWFDNLGSFTVTVSGCEVKGSEVKFMPTDIDPSTGLPTAMHGSFTPGAGLSAAAKACGFIGFNWQQTVDVLPCPSDFGPADPSVAGIGQANMCSDGSLKAPPSFPDPLPGGYTYAASQQPPFLEASPFYYNPVDVPGIAGDILAGCAETDETGTACIMSITNSPTTPVCTNCDTTLNFVDTPSDPLLLIAALDGTGSFVSFTTSLVGVKAGNIPASALIASDTGRPLTVSWKSDYDGTSGGVGTLTNNRQVDPGAGTGGVTILSLFGTQQIPPSVSCTANPSVLWPPNGKSVLVTVTGNIGPGTQAIPAGSSAYAVTDEYGQDQPRGSVTFGAGGSYSFGVPLVAARNGSDKTGRTYTIIVAAKDNIGNVGNCSAVVKVPHDQGH